MDAFTELTLYVVTTVDTDGVMAVSHSGFDAELAGTLATIQTTSPRVLETTVEAVRITEENWPHQTLFHHMQEPKQYLD